MAYVGQTLENPASGERITFRATAAQTDGELVAIDLELPPGARVPGGLHIHLKQEERRGHGVRYAPEPATVPGR
jgi:hypothetical protein